MFQPATARPVLLVPEVLRDQRVTVVMLEDLGTMASPEQLVLPVRPDVASRETKELRDPPDSQAEETQGHKVYQDSTEEMVHLATQVLLAFRVEMDLMA